MSIVGQIPDSPSFLSDLLTPFCFVFFCIFQLFAAIYRRSGGYGKPDSVSRTMACAYLLKLFRDGRLGQWTLDDATDLILQHEVKERRIQSGVGVGQGIAGLELAPVMNLDEHGEGPSFWDGLGSRRKAAEEGGQ
jgi:hypothetical protein